MSQSDTRSAAGMSQSNARSARGDEEAPGHYWSYRALLEDKKRCLTGIPHVKHEYCNSLQREGEDCAKSQRALAERTRHNDVCLKKTWDPNGVKTPPHAFLSDPNQPHFSQKELAERKKNGMTAIRRPASARPAAPSWEGPGPADSDFGKRAKRSAKDIAQANQGDKDTTGLFEAPPTMKELMKPMTNQNRRLSTERQALQERRSSSVPHDSHEVITWKKKFHATKLHATKTPRSMSARELGRQPSWSQAELLKAQEDEGTNQQRDALTKSYQGLYPYGGTSEAWPNGRDDPKQVGRYRSQAYLSIDKRRHAARIDGDVENQKSRARDSQSDAGSEAETNKDRIQYRSQHALAQHKKRHLANLYQDADGYQCSQAGDNTPYSDRGGMNTKQDLFTSHKNLDYGKRGHVVTLNSAVGLQKMRRNGSVGGDSESSCDVGKGISRMMHKHRPDTVHTSQVEFHLKKKNHATGVHTTPRPPTTSETQEYEDIGANVLVENRRQSNPHNSCKAFALKKKYHQTQVHVKPASRLHPETLKAETFDPEPAVMTSQSKLNTLKKIHLFEYDPEVRVRTQPTGKPIPVAPVPRNGQWTPQHICD